MKYLFYDKVRGSIVFDVETEKNEPFPVDKVTGLLAMYCFATNHQPADYQMLVEGNRSQLAECQRKAEDLIKMGYKIRTDVRLTRREKQVLSGVIRHLINKEIANELNLSERTVKFHVSALLQKFKVDNRSALAEVAKERNNELELDSLSRDKHQLPAGVENSRCRVIRRVVPARVGTHAVAV